MVLEKERIKIESRISFQTELSNTLESIYEKSPVFKNELINKDKISAQANAARTKLMVAMLENESIKDLSFDKYPAEKSIYLSLLKESKIHKINNKGIWSFSKPKKNQDPPNVLPAWEIIESFLNNSQKDHWL